MYSMENKDFHFSTCCREELNTVDRYEPIMSEPTGVGFDEQVI